ncbi:cysteine synthase A [Campylobacter ureolyticus]|uniref:cysteine synthase A n=1 Tax=Campylobacter ureolyticus TaxID=827 RepID=UPI0022B2B4D9|nr:cysteine synthase A [Campylobacter ureolyticus]MCZ6110740.1 cysteine synthase A [Campylobacter ureolyticus]
MKVASSVIDLIGNTPLVRINSFSKNAEILAKVEFLNPSHSIKDRTAFSMIDDAIKKGKIDKNTTIIEPTSGNTGVGLAMICAYYGLKLILTMPSSMSIERQKLLKIYGAKLVLTDPSLGMKGAVEESENIASKTTNSFIPSQFENPANPKIHELTTAREILKDTDGKVDIFVAGFGTGGTVSGVGKALKNYNPSIKVVAVEPLSSPLLTKGQTASHKIQGIGANFVPKNLNKSVIDEFLDVSDEDAFSVAMDLATKEGLLVGISSGANVFAANLLAKRNENKDKTIVTILCDTGERYLSLFS